ncbi:MAG: hypothetical protein WA947_02375 [Phormidesmis sp.]
MITKSIQENQLVLDRTEPFSQGNHVWLQKLDIAKIAQKYSTPLYITNQTRLLENFRKFANLLDGENNVYLPVKTSPCLATYKVLAEQGCGADCASLREVQLAHLAGIPTARLSYYSPAPDLNLAVSLLQGGGSVIIDSASKLAALEEIIGQTPFSGKLFLRVNSPLYNSYLSKADYQKHTSHGALTSQFGFPSEEVISLLSSTKLPFSGLHSHVGTQMDNVEIFQESLDALHELCEVIHAVTDHKIDVLNLGGGLGIAACKEDSFPSIAELSNALKPKFKSEFTYKMEPGNALFGNATALLTRVITRKSTRGKGWAIVDVGSNQLMKVTLAGFSQEVLLADGTSLPREGTDSIAGPLCFAGDVILPETNLTGVEEGDLLLLPNVGAYCRAISNRFNGQAEPGTLMVEENREIGLVYTSEDSHWDPIIQSYRPQRLNATDEPLEMLSEQQVDKLRSLYLHKQCADDTYSFHDFTKVSSESYEMTVKVDSPVSFISAPLVMRIISDATVAAVVNSLGHDEKEMSVWGSRFNVSLNSILRSNRPHLLRIYLTPRLNLPQSKKREFIAYWQFGEGDSHGNILVVV